MSFLVIEVALSLEIKDDFAWVLEFPVLRRSLCCQSRGHQHMGSFFNPAVRKNGS